MEKILDSLKTEMGKRVFLLWARGVYSRKDVVRDYCDGEDSAVREDLLWLLDNVVV